MNSLKLIGDKVTNFLTGSKPSLSVPHQPVLSAVNGDLLSTSTKVTTRQCNSSPPNPKVQLFVGDEGHEINGYLDLNIVLCYFSCCCNRLTTNFDAPLIYWLAVL